MDSRKDIVHNVVMVSPLDQAFSLRGIATQGDTSLTLGFGQVLYIAVAMVII